MHGAQAKDMRESTPPPPITCFNFAYFDRFMKYFVRDSLRQHIHGIPQGGRCQTMLLSVMLFPQQMILHLIVFHPLLYFSEAKLHWTFWKQIPCKPDTRNHKWWKTFLKIKKKRKKKEGQPFIVGDVNSAFRVQSITLCSVYVKQGHWPTTEWLCTVTAI